VVAHTTAGAEAPLRFFADTRKKYFVPATRPATVSLVPDVESTGVNVTLSALSAIVYIEGAPPAVGAVHWIRMRPVSIAEATKPVGMEGTGR
jgi:hypothetical protein